MVGHPGRYVSQQIGGVRGDRGGNVWGRDRGLGVVSLDVVLEAVQVYQVRKSI